MPRGEAGESSRVTTLQLSNLHEMIQNAENATTTGVSMTVVVHDHDISEHC